LWVVGARLFCLNHSRARAPFDFAQGRSAPRTHAGTWRKIRDMIPQDLLEILVCPVCKQPLTLRDKDSQQSLKCKQCRRVYPVRDDIPILLADEATIDLS
jgi:uncharacterized protein YbaR (Trm112 family)